MPSSKLSAKARLVAAVKAALPEDRTKHGGTFIDWDGSRVRKIKMSIEAYDELCAALDACERHDV